MTDQHYGTAPCGCHRARMTAYEFGGRREGSCGWGCSEHPDGAWHAASAIASGLRAIAGWPGLPEQCRSVGAFRRAVERLGRDIEREHAKFVERLSAPIWGNPGGATNPGRIYDNERTPPRERSPDWDAACSEIAETLANWASSVAPGDTPEAQRAEALRVFNEALAYWLDHPEPVFGVDRPAPEPPLRGVRVTAAQLAAGYRYAQQQFTEPVYVGTIELPTHDTERPPSPRTACYWCKAPVVDGRCTACEQRQP